MCACLWMHAYTCVFACVYVWAQKMTWIRLAAVDGRTVLSRLLGAEFWRSRRSSLSEALIAGGTLLCWVLPCSDWLSCLRGRLGPAASGNRGWDFILVDWLSQIHWWQHGLESLWKDLIQITHTRTRSYKWSCLSAVMTPNYTLQSDLSVQDHLALPRPPSTVGQPLISLLIKKNHSI